MLPRVYRPPVVPRRAPAQAWRHTWVAPALNPKFIQALNPAAGRGEGHISAVSAVAFSCKSDAFIVSGGADKLLKVWDLAAALEPRAGAAAAEPAAKKKKGGKKGSEAIEAAAGKDDVRELKVTAAVAAHDKDINAVAVSPNDAFICTASQDRTAKVRTCSPLT